MTTIDDLDLPHTDLTAAANAWVRSIETPVLVNHCIRSYVFGRALGRIQNLEPGEDYDDELLFLGCLLHDVGLTDPGDGDQRFEVDGADLAVGFLTDNGLSEDRAEIVWDAIALHTSRGIAHRKRPEIALAHAGIGVDVVGGPLDLPSGLAARTLDALPRMGLHDALRQAVVRQAAAKPSKAPPYTFPGELVRTYAPDVGVPTWDDLVAASRWDGEAT